MFDFSDEQKKQMDGLIKAYIVRNIGPILESSDVLYSLVEETIDLEKERIKEITMLELEKQSEQIIGSILKKNLNRR
jgi:hypothetical protein